MHGSSRTTLRHRDRRFEWDRLRARRRRRQWKQRQGKISAARLVFIDETWAKTNMTRTHGWCDKGKPLVDKVPHGHWKTLTVIAGLAHDGIIAPCVLDGPINGASFTAWVEQFLTRTCDRATSSSSTISAATKARQCVGRSEGRRQALLLPPYSPDLNPIEQMFSKLKRCYAKKMPAGPRRSNARSASCCPA